MTLVLKRATTSPTLSETGKPSRIYTPSLASAAVPASCPFQAAGVTIEEIYLQGESGQTTLRADPLTVDFCDLGHQALLLVQNADVPAGSYQEIRFVISGGYVQDPADGKVYATPGYDVPAALAPADGTLQTPSWGSSGLKVPFDGGSVAIDGADKVVALDFNLAQSYAKLAGGAQWVMSPVIKATDISFTGSVQVRLNLGPGVTLPTVDGVPVTFTNFDVTATHSGAGVTQAFDPVAGTTMFFVSPHDTPYTLTLGIPPNLDVVATPASHSVMIEEGAQAETVEFTLTSVSIPTGVANRPPQANFATPARPSFNATVGVAVSFDPAGTYDPEGPWGGAWDFGDGETFTGTFANYPSHIVTHTYPAAGNYTVTWTVHDEEGATSVATTTAVVTAAP